MDLPPSKTFPHQHLVVRKHIGLVLVLKEGKGGSVASSPFEKILQETFAMPRIIEFTPMVGSEHC